MSLDDTHGIEVTPELIQELLEKGLVTIDKEDGTRINLMYDTIPRSQSEGWNE